jgi:hypothetical protein
MATGKTVKETTTKKPHAREKRKRNKRSISLHLTLIWPKKPQW